MSAAHKYVHEESNRQSALMLVIYCTRKGNHFGCHFSPAGDILEQGGAQFGMTGHVFYLLPYLVPLGQNVWVLSLLAPPVQRLFYHYNFYGDNLLPHARYNHVTCKL